MGSVSWTADNVAAAVLCNTRSCCCWFVAVEVFGPFSVTYRKMHLPPSRVTKFTAWREEGIDDGEEELFPPKFLTVPPPALT